MSDTHQATLTGKLPLKGEKQPTAKIVGVVVLLLTAIIANYVIFHEPAKKVNKKQPQETYDLGYGKQDPITTTTLTNPVAAVNTQEELAIKLQEAKAKDFIERLQATQTIEGSHDMSMANSPVHMTNNNETSVNGPFVTNTTDPNTAFLMQESNTKAPHVYATHFGPKL